MIVGEQKPLDEIKEFLTDSEKVLVVGCGTCVTVCFSGGEKEAQVLASSLRMSTKLDGDSKEVTDVTIQRQCEYRMGHHRVGSDGEGRRRQPNRQFSASPYTGMGPKPRKTIFAMEPWGVAEFPQL